jgi:hypothetical protein
MAGSAACGLIICMLPFWCVSDDEAMSERDGEVNRMLELTLRIEDKVCELTQCREPRPRGCSRFFHYSCFVLICLQSLTLTFSLPIIARTLSSLTFITISVYYSMTVLLNSLMMLTNDDLLRSSCI